MIHFLISRNTIVQTCIDQFNRLLIVVDWNDGQVLDVYLANIQVLAYLELTVSRIKQIMDLLAIDLHEGQADGPVVVALFRR